MLQAFLHTTGMYVLSSLHNQGHKATFQSTRGTWKQIDYLLGTRSLAAEVLSTSALDIGASDHRAVACIVSTSPQQRSPQRSSHRGWQLGSVEVQLARWRLDSGVRDTWQFIKDQVSSCRPPSKQPDPWLLQCWEIRRARRRSTEPCVIRSLWRLEWQVRKDRAEHIHEWRFELASKYSKGFPKQDRPWAPPPRQIQGTPDRTLWVPHFEAFMATWARPDRPRTQPPTPTTTTFPAFTVDEVSTVLQKLHNGRSAGCDGVSPELFKQMFQHERGTQHLCRAFNDVLQNPSHMPPEWPKVDTVFVPKTTSASLCSDFRPIGLVCVGARLYLSLLVLRLVQQTALPEWIFAYRKGRQASELYFALSLIAEQSMQWRQGLVIAKLDVRKAYDSISHDLIARALASQCADATLNLLLCSFLFGRSYRVHFQGRSGAWFPFTRGLVQ
eukprot:3507296-Amphidinium_carterae.1